MDQKLYGGIEIGGTKTICAIGGITGNLIAWVTIPTTTVKETFAAVFEFFGQNTPVTSLGVGSFGPVQLQAASAEYGSIYNSPKAGWSKVAVKNMLEAELKLRVSIDTDVNCAALGELHYGVAKQTRNFIYLTLGTGIGGSLISDGQLIHGLSNLEMGHMRVPHEPFNNSFRGACSFHNDCLEGIASGHAMAQRYGKKAHDITDPEAWKTEATYVALALNNLMVSIGPELIIVGGGLIKHPSLLPDMRLEVQRIINGYLSFPTLESYIVQSSGDMNGVLGAIRLASMAV